MKRYVSIACAGLMVVALAGCGKVKEEVANKVNEKVAEKMAEAALKKDGAKDAKVDIKKDGSVSVETTNEKGEKTSITNTGGTFTSTSAQGSMMIGEGAKIPEDFPKDVPVYAGVKVVGAMKNTENGGTFSLNLESADPIAKVGEYYKKEMVAQGWTAEQSTEMAGDSPMVMLNFKKGEMGTMIMATKEGDKTTINLVVSKQ